MAIPNMGGDKRERDYTPPYMGRAIDDPDSPKGAGDRFLAFLKNELLPDTDRRYRTTPVRMLMGHSRGGLLAAYSLMAEPGLFQARFVHSAPVWRYDAIVVTKLSEYLATRPASGSFFYMSVGSKETEQMIGGYERLRSVLASDAPPALRWVAERSHPRARGTSWPPELLISCSRAGSLHVSRFIRRLKAAGA